MRKQSFEVFDEQKERMKRFYQEGMMRVEDAPSEVNMQQTKESLALALKSDLKNALEIFSTAMTECLNGIEKILLDPINLNESELKTMDLILGSKLILKFFTGLSGSEEGLIGVIEALRVWECSAPMVKKERLNTLIIGLKNLKEPVTAGTVVGMLREGLPSRMDLLIDHMIATTEKTMGPLGVITIASWQALSTKSSVEQDLSIRNATPLATSSVADMVDKEEETSTRQTLEKLKSKIRQATSALDKQ